MKACQFLFLTLLATAFLPPQAMASEAMAVSKNCMTCHTVYSKAIGPSFESIRKRYRGMPATVSIFLAFKIKTGSVGGWGKVRMPPNNQVTDAEANELANWIMEHK